MGDFFYSCKVINDNGLQFGFKDDGHVIIRLVINIYSSLHGQSCLSPGFLYMNNSLNNHLVPVYFGYFLYKTLNFSTLKYFTSSTQIIKAFVKPLIILFTSQLRFNCLQRLMVSVNINLKVSIKHTVNKTKKVARPKRFLTSKYLFTKHETSLYKRQNMCVKIKSSYIM